MRRLNKLNCIIVALIIAAAGVFSAVAYGGNADTFEKGIIGFNLEETSSDSVQDWIDGELTDSAGEGSEWYVIALSKQGDYDFSGYNAALKRYLSENEVGSASSRLKYALTFVALGNKSEPYITEVLGNSIGEQGIMSLVFGLHLLNNGLSCESFSVSSLVADILSSQHSDGGWSVFGDYGDTDVTAMTVQALAAHYEKNSAVKSAVDKALGFLSARQLEGGGYSAYGVENPESSAQVIIALSSLNIDASQDERFIKNGNTVFDSMEKFRLSDGSFSHKEGEPFNSTATAQVLCSAIAYENMGSGKAPFYIFEKSGTAAQLSSVSETVSETESITAETSASAQVTQIQDSVTEKAESHEKNEADSERFWFIVLALALAAICALMIFRKKFGLAAVIALVSIIIAAVVVSCFSQTEKPSGSVTISISCDVIKDSGESHVPRNGIVLDETEVRINEGDTVYDVFSQVCKEKGILFSANMKYIEGINNIFETDFGKSSGWMYFVNGQAPSVGCGSFELSDGDSIEWHYTCNMGKDLDFEII